MRSFLLATPLLLPATGALAHADPAAHVHAGETVIQAWQVGAGLGAVLAVVWLAAHLRARAEARK